MPFVYSRKNREHITRSHIKREVWLNLLLRELHVSGAGKVTEEWHSFILQDIEMTGVAESQRHNYIHPKILILMEIRALRLIDFVIRIVRLESAVFSLCHFCGVSF